MKILRVVEHIQHDFLVFLSGAREKGSKGRILKGKWNIIESMRKCTNTTPEIHEEKNCGK